MSANEALPPDRRSTPAQERAEAMRRAAADASQKSYSFLRPRVYQAWCNLRVWLPFFDTPNRRARQVVYAPSDCRTGLTWDVPLPKQCCRCGRQDGLTAQPFQQEVRAFDFPLHIAGISGMVAFGVLFLAFLASSFVSSFILLSLLACAAFTLTVGAVLIYLKSWEEEVLVRLWTCPDHAGEAGMPDMVVNDNELTLVLPSESLTEATLAEQKERRRGKARSNAESSGSGPRPGSRGGPPAAIPIGTPPLPTRPVIPDLPPIKLAGDDDDPLP